jgi:hypothetical protein
MTANADTVEESKSEGIQINGEVYLFLPQGLGGVARTSAELEPRDFNGT